MLPDPVDSWFECGAWRRRGRGKISTIVLSEASEMGVTFDMEGQRTQPARERPRMLADHAERNRVVTVEQRNRDMEVLHEVVRGALWGPRGPQFRFLMSAAGFTHVQELENEAWGHFAKLYPFPARYKAWFYAVLYNFLVDRAERESRFRRADDCNTRDTAVEENEIELWEALGRSSDLEAVNPQEIAEHNELATLAAQLGRSLPGSVDRLPSLRDRCVLRLRYARFLGPQPEDYEYVAGRLGISMTEAILRVTDALAAHEGEPDEPTKTSVLLPFFACRRATLDQWVHRAQERLATELKRIDPRLGDYLCGPSGGTKHKHKRIKK